MKTGHLTTEQLAGQRLMVGFEGTRPSDELKWLIAELKVGGIILFAQNIESPAQIKMLCDSAQNYAAAAGQPPLFIAVDQEGGMVARLREPFTLFPGNPAMQGIADAEAFAETTAEELKSVGINMNMAPVMDVPPDGFESVMDGRVFGSDPEWVARMGAAVIEKLQQHNMMAVAKHFPGIGRTTLDSHIDMPLLDTPADELIDFDLVPFRAAVGCHVAGIMMSHIKYTQIDPEWPASLSPAIVTGILRRKMGYDGLVLTDDLDMGSIQKYYPIESSIRQIVAADIDIALICHKGPDIEAASIALRQAAAASAEMNADFRRSVERILSLKRTYLVPRTPAARSS